MPADIRDYLLERFRSDAGTLRQRADSLQSSGTGSPGPDAAVSRAMANACDDVAMLAEALPQHASLAAIVSALHVMLPELTRRATAPEAMATPAVRAVYVGACTRVQEVITAETSAATAERATGVDGADDWVEANDDDLDEEDLAVDGDDDDVDDDDLYDGDAFPDGVQ